MDGWEVVMILLKTGIVGQIWPKQALHTCSLPYDMQGNIIPPSPKLIGDRHKTLISNCE